MIRWIVGLPLKLRRHADGHTLRLSRIAQAFVSLFDLTTTFVKEQTKKKKYLGGFLNPGNR
jgi:hypothetical protein